MITAPASWPTWAQVLGGLGIAFAVSAVLVGVLFGLKWLMNLGDR